MSKIHGTMLGTGCLIACSVDGGNLTMTVVCGDGTVTQVTLDGVREAEELVNEILVALNELRAANQ